MKEDIVRCPLEDRRLRLAIFTIVRELRRSRSSVARLAQATRKQRREIRKLEKRISSFIEPN